MTRYSELTIKKLFGLSMNVCSYCFNGEPACEEPLIDPEGHSVMARICHIEARSPGGPRYNVEMNDDERWAFENLILMCPNHHTMVDDIHPERYSVEVLTKMKFDAERSGSRSTWAEKNDTLIDRAVTRTIVIMDRLNLLVPLEPFSMKEPVTLQGAFGVTANFSAGFVGNGAVVDHKVTRAPRDDLVIGENVTHVTNDQSVTGDPAT